MGHAIWCSARSQMAAFPAHRYNANIQMYELLRNDESNSRVPNIDPQYFLLDIFLLSLRAAYSEGEVRESAAIRFPALMASFCG